MFRVCVLCILLYYVIVVDGALSGGAFFCRDPDTGKLYPINTTWSSSSFCGNYHCKLRKKNQTELTYKPLRQSDVIKITLDNNKSAVKPVTDNTFNAKSTTSVNSIVNKLVIPVNKTRQETDEKDRYLSENEIQTISEALQKVRRSDLDAIMEIYIAAHDIFSEFEDNIDIENLKNKILKQSKNLNSDRTTVKPTPYEAVCKPLATEISKKYTQNKPLIPLKKIATVKELILPNTITARPMKTKLEKVVEYFNGPLTKKDFRKLPYYYPASAFQRSSSYIYNPINPPIFKPVYQTSPASVILTPPSIQLPNKPNYHQQLYIPYRYLPLTNHYADTSFVKDTISSKDSPQTKNVVLLNPALEDMHNVDVKSDFLTNAKKENPTIEKDKKKTKPKWQTDPLPQNVLDEIRAFITEKKVLKPLRFPLRKMVKLEEVEKVTVGYEDLRRKKRSDVGNKDKSESTTPLPSPFEVYIEKITCQADYTVPGFFRYGNLSLPYPSCCPERIK